MLVLRAFMSFLTLLCFIFNSRNKLIKTWMNFHLFASCINNNIIALMLLSTWISLTLSLLFSFSLVFLGAIIKHLQTHPHRYLITVINLNFLRMCVNGNTFRILQYIFLKFRFRFVFCPPLAFSQYLSEVSYFNYCLAGKLSFIWMQKGYNQCMRDKR